MARKVRFIFHAERHKVIMEESGKMRVVERGEEKRLTKGVPETPDIQPSLTDQKKVISPVDQGLGAKH